MGGWASSAIKAEEVPGNGRSLRRLGIWTVGRGGVDGILPPSIISPRQGICTSIIPSALMLTWRVPASTSGVGAESMLYFIDSLRITGW